MSAQTRANGDPIAAVLSCPHCEQPLRLRGEGLESRCAKCERPVPCDRGVLDLVTDPARAEERRHYDREYAMEDGPGTGVDMAQLARVWRDPARPIDQAILESVGDITGKVVLLLGNGGSLRELHFLTQDPELLVASDLSVEGLRPMAAGAEAVAGGSRLCCAAIDALKLPIQDESVDLIYAMALVHHLPDLDRFLVETMRVLRPGGRAVFLDDAYSPVWQRAKTTWLRPLMRLSHKQVPRSPEDLRHTLEGGFVEEELARRIEAVGGKPFFSRYELVLYLWQRAAEVGFPRRLQRLRNHPAIAPRLARLDERLARYAAIRRNQIRLLWGLQKR